MGDTTMTNSYDIQSIQTSSQSQPLVSIGMPVYNCAGTVAQAICSILNQTLIDWELIIIDDSTDNTLEVIASFADPRIVVTKGDGKKGLPVRLNECISKAKGKFFARMDGDDIAYPGRLQSQLEYLQNHSEVDLVGGWMVVFRSDGTVVGTRRGPLTHEQICEHSWKGIAMAHPTWMGRIEWFRRNGYHIVIASEDQELLSRTYQNSQFANIPQVVLGYREDRLSLPYLLFQRWYNCKRIVRAAYQERRLIRVVRPLVGEGAKGLLDTIAIVTGLKYHVLRHRARAIHSNEEAEWRSVWKQIRLTSDRLLTDRKCLSNSSQSTTI
jgi:glycosyltransferase involved in cell wall biosynthesis